MQGLNKVNKSHNAVIASITALLYSHKTANSRKRRTGNVPEKMHLFEQGFTEASIFEKPINDAYSVDLNRFVSPFLAFTPHFESAVTSLSWDKNFNVLRR